MSQPLACGKWSPCSQQVMPSPHKNKQAYAYTLVTQKVNQNTLKCGLLFPELYCVVFPMGTLGN